VNPHLNWALGVWSSDLCNRPAEAVESARVLWARRREKGESDGAQLQLEALVEMRFLRATAVLAMVLTLALVAGASVRPI